MSGRLSTHQDEIMRVTSHYLFVLLILFRGIQASATEPEPQPAKAITTAFNLCKEAHGEALGYQERKAIKKFDYAIRLYPLPIGYLWRGQAKALIGEDKASELDFKKALETAQKSDSPFDVTIVSQAASELAFSLKKQGDSSQGLAVLDQICKEPSDEKVLARGRYLFALEKFDKARADFTIGHAMNKCDIETLIKLGVCCDKINQNNDAVAAFTKAINCIDGSGHKFDKRNRFRLFELRAKAYRRLGKT